MRYWLVDLDGDWPLDTLADLSPTEQAKAARFHQAQHALRYSRARWALRHILGQLTAQAPHDLALGEGPHGKPSLPQHPALSFNVSHSQQWALIATSERGAVGVDIEHIRPLAELEGLMQQVLTPAEAQHLRSGCPADPSATFLRTWTRKEACLKAIGVGLNAEPHTLDLLPGTLNGTHTTTLMHADVQHTLQWQDLDLPPDCHALATCAWACPA